jgi:hypothetical protein
VKGVKVKAKHIPFNQKKNFLIDGIMQPLLNIGGATLMLGQRFIAHTSVQPFHIKTT